MNPTILILTGVAAVAVLAAVALLVMGKGGQLARFEADHAPLDLPADRPLSGADVARIGLPLSMWGYHVRAVDEVLHRVADALKERDARIEELEHRLAGGDPDSAATVIGAGPVPAGPVGVHAAGQGPAESADADSALDPRAPEAEDEASEQPDAGTVGDDDRHAGRDDDGAARSAPSVHAGSHFGDGPAAERP